MTVTAIPTSTSAAVEAAAAAAAVLPSEVPLVPGATQPFALVPLAEYSGAAVVADPADGGPVVGVLVRSELSEALANSPVGALDLGAALQPALDAAASVLGLSPEPATTVALEQLAAVASADLLAVPLVHQDATVAVVLLRPVPDAPGPSAGAPPRAAGTRTAGSGIELLHGVEMELTVELGRTRLTVRELLELAPGDVLDLDRTAGSPADLLVNGRPVARGEIVVVDESFALRVTEIIASPEA